MVEKLYQLVLCFTLTKPMFLAARTVCRAWNTDRFTAPLLTNIKMSLIDQSTWWGSEIDKLVAVLRVMGRGLQRFTWDTWHGHDIRYPILMAIIGHIPNVRELALNIVQSPMTIGTDVRPITHRNMTVLRLSGNALPHCLLTVLGLFPNLRELHDNRCTSESPLAHADLADILRAAPGLVRLTFRGNTVGRMADTFTRLRWLRISVVTSHFVDAPAIVRALPGLEVLGMYGGCFCGPFDPHPRLRRIDIGWGMTGPSLTMFLPLADTLQELRAPQIQYWNQDILAFVRAMPKLRDLDITPDSVYDHGAYLQTMSLLYSRRNRPSKRSRTRE